MSRPSSFHGANHRDSDDDFSLPLFTTSQAQAYAPPPQLIQAQPAPPPAPPPRSPLRAAQQLQQPGLSPATHLTPTLPTQASPYAPPTLTFPSANVQNHQNATGTATGQPGPHSAHPSSSPQRQSMNFPSYGASAYQDDMNPQGSSALGSLARSASLGTARRKDPFSYPSDDVESGMAAEWGAGAPPYGHPTQQMPQPYVNTNRSTSDVMPSPNQARYSQQLPSLSNSMPPPALPINRGPALMTNVMGGSSVASPAGTTPSQASSTLSVSNPSNPYVPRAGEGADPWNSYRRNSSHQSPPSGSVSPLGASPHSPAVGGYDRSPHLLTPQGSNSNLPTSPNIGFPASPQQHQSHRGYQSNRSHSQSFTVSQPVTPSGRYEPAGSFNRHRTTSTSPRQGLRPVREWSDLKPKVNAHPQGRRADTTIPGRYMSVGGDENLSDNSPSNALRLHCRRRIRYAIRHSSMRRRITRDACSPNRASRCTMMERTTRTGIISSTSTTSWGASTAVTGTLICGKH